MYIQLCKDNPLNLEKVPFLEQTEKLIRIACEACSQTPGVSPFDLLHFIRQDLRQIVDEYQWYWGIDTSTGQYEIYEI